ncbi:glycosyltransferase family 2 protein [Candidatus Latescibacterota bacterium]
MPDNKQVIQQNNTYEVDIIIPVYNEGDNIWSTLEALFTTNTTSFCVYIVYDRDDDDTLPSIDRFFSDQKDRILLVKNEGAGPHGAILTGFRRSTSKYVIAFPADDDYNSGLIDKLILKQKEGDCEIVCASRFTRGGCMVDCPWLKSLLVRLSSFFLYHVARIPSHDSSNGLRLFSRRILNEIKIESVKGFTYSLELLVKAHRKGYKICEVPAYWYERSQGKSRFKVLMWLPGYLRWFFYGMATFWLRRKKV